MNKDSKPQFNIDIVFGSISPVADEKATKALQFYEQHADALDTPIYFEKLVDLNYESIDMNLCRAYCRVGKSYSHAKFMAFIAEWFGTTVKEMKTQWRNIK